MPVEAPDGHEAVNIPSVVVTSTSTVGLPERRMRKEEEGRRDRRRGGREGERERCGWVGVRGAMGRVTAERARTRARARECACACAWAMVASVVVRRPRRPRHLRHPRSLMHDPPNLPRESMISRPWTAVMVAMVRRPAGAAAARAAEKADLAAIDIW